MFLRLYSWAHYNQNATARVFVKNVRGEEIYRKEIQLRRLKGMKLVAIKIPTKRYDGYIGTLQMLGGSGEVQSTHDFQFCVSPSNLNPGLMKDSYFGVNVFCQEPMFGQFKRIGMKKVRQYS